MSLEPPSLDRSSKIHPSILLICMYRSGACLSCGTYIVWASTYQIPCRLPSPERAFNTFRGACMPTVVTDFTSIHDSYYDSTQNDYTFLTDFTSIHDSNYDSLKSIKCVVINLNLTTTISKLLPSPIPISFHNYIKKISLSGCARIPMGVHESDRSIAKSTSAQIAMLRLLWARYVW